MKKSFVLIVILICLSGWYSCTKDKAPAPTASLCDSTQVTYNNTISRIVSTNCTEYSGCHNPATGLGSAGGINATALNTLAEVKAEMALDTTNTNSIVCRLRGTTCGLQMPYGLRPLSAAYVDTFLLWQANNYCE